MSLLLAALLLADGIAVHGFDHAHVGGEESHSHADDVTGIHGCGSHACSHHDDHSEAQSPKGKSNLTAASVSHTHLTFFGLDFSIPASDDSRDGEQESPSAFVLLANDCVIVPNARSIDIELLRPLSLTATLGEVVANHIAAMTVPQVASLPLCDCARFERSGVLLI